MSWCTDDCFWIKNVAILNVKSVDYRCNLWGISKSDAVNILNNSVLEKIDVYSKWNLIQMKHLLK